MRILMGCKMSFGYVDRLRHNDGSGLFTENSRERSCILSFFIRRLRIQLLVVLKPPKLNYLFLPAKYQHGGRANF